MLKLKIPSPQPSPRFGGEREQDEARRLRGCGQITGALVKPRRHADLGSSNLHFAVRARHPDLFRTRWIYRLPVHRIFHGRAHPGKPPAGAGDAAFTPG
jgi:hypothetical protein